MPETALTFHENGMMDCKGNHSVDFPMSFDLWGNFFDICFLKELFTIFAALLKKSCRNKNTNKKSNRVYTLVN